MQFVVCFLLLVPSVMTERTSFKLDATFNDLDLFQDVSLGSPSLDEQPNECGRHCVRTPQCTMFSFNEERESCQLYGDAVYPNVSLAQPEPGERYFIYETGWCPLKNQFFVYRSVNMCVKIPTVEMDYDSAKLWCAHFGARLVVPEDEAKATAVINLLEKLGLTNTWTFLGADEITTEGLFVWADGRRMVRDWWRKPSEPNNMEGDEDCVFVNDGKLFDYPCHKELKFICEIPEQIISI